MTLAGYNGGLVNGANELEQVYEVRMIVFVEEQNVPPEEELDAYDLTATHFLMREITTKRVVATARFLDKGERVGKVGRVAVLKEYRGLGIGAEIMRLVEDHASVQGYRELLLEAQTHAIVFYEKLGYLAEGEIYLDCDIEHRVMRKELGVRN